jgi:hypothetical protein
MKLFEVSFDMRVPALIEIEAEDEDQAVEKLFNTPLSELMGYAFSNSSSIVDGSLTVVEQLEEEWPTEQAGKAWAPVWKNK